MKDVVLLSDKTQLHALLESIDGHEQQVIDQFNVIFDRFLGDKERIAKTYQTFLSWRPIRDEVLNLHRMGKRNEAIRITQRRGAAHVLRLQKEVHEFVEFAIDKAEEFYQVGRQKRDSSLYVVTTIAVISVIGTIMIGVVVVSMKRKADKEIIQQNHLVDQNIMMARLDLDGNVVKISNALCRFLQTTKEDIVGQASDFFEISSNKENLCAHIFTTLKTGKEWHGEICRVNPDGMQYFASSTVLPNYNDHFQVVGYTNILQDATSKKLSVTDKLTTLSNRRAFEEIFDREVRIANRNDTRLTLAILDVDFFKLYNDNYGHPQGDVGLKQVATIIDGCLKRPNDYVFRVGGEEFAILLPELDRNQSQKVLDSIRNAIEAAHIIHEFSTVSDYLTVSIGAFVYSGMQGNGQIDIYNEADKALYLAKETRNIVVVTDRQE
jgi:diguanylate cyclase (GGDEF)-like protein/PAS domain S-box-containing protein